MPSAPPAPSIESLLWLGVALVTCCQAQIPSDFVTSLCVVLQVLWHLDDHHHNYTTTTNHHSGCRRRPVQSSLRRRGGGGISRPRAPAPPTQPRVVRWKTTTTTTSPSVPKRNTTSIHTNNNTNHKTTMNPTTVDADGRFMGTVVPHALWQGLSLRGYARYTLLGSALWWWRAESWSSNHDNHNHSNNRSLWHTGGTLILLLAVLLHSDDVYSPSQAIPFCLLWWILYDSTRVSDRISQAVTPGEWFVVTNLTAVALTEGWRRPDHDASNVEPSQHFYARVAVAGLVGCVLACLSVEWYDKFRGRTNPSETPHHVWIVVLRAIVMVVMALGTVEVTVFRWGPDPQKHNSQYWWFPKCLHWMFTNFLWTVETPMIPVFDDHSFLWNMSNLPRGAWLLYWVAILVVTLPLAPTAAAPSSHNDNNNNNNNNRAILLVRKWFHLVAVLLFGPVTILAPQLMSLSYAVAIGLLLLLESLRLHLAWLDQFYRQYLDVHNKQEHSNQVVISHLALIVGCAVPLWLAQWKTATTMTTTATIPILNAATTTATSTPALMNSSLRLFLSLWGVIVTGIGDAMGAVIGATYGRRYWGHHRRTIEGSLAMLASLIGVCSALTTMMTMTTMDSGMNWRRWLPVCIVSTLLEAFTLQIDNLVLPLVGVALLLFL